MPILGGTEISRADGPPGSLGCVVRWNSEPNDLFILSNAHVLVLGGDKAPRVGDAIISPSRGKGGTALANTIATLANWSPLDAGPGYPNVVDAAIARIVAGSVSPAIQGIGIPAGIGAPPYVGMSVKLSGAASTLGKGAVTSVDRSFEFTYPKPEGGNGLFGFSGLIVCTRFTDEGDSGAIVLDDANRVVGLHMAGSDSQSVFAPIRSVMSLLDITVVTSLPDGDVAAQAAADTALLLGFKPAIGQFFLAVDILGRTLWGEARGEVRSAGEKALVAVAAVIANRVRAQQGHWGMTVEQVCKKPAQFSCWNPPVDPQNRANREAMEAVGPDDALFNRCLDIAQRTLAGQITDPTNGATSYCNQTKDVPYWAVGKTPCCPQIGNHTFYKGL